MTGDEELTAQLAEALEAEEARPQRETDPDAVIETQNWDGYARALLPVVRKLINLGAAEELDTAAWPGNVSCTRDRLLLLDRAAALRGAGE